MWLHFMILEDFTFIMGIYKDVTNGVSIMENVFRTGFEFSFQC